MLISAPISSFIDKSAKMCGNISVEYMVSDRSGFIIAYISSLIIAFRESVLPKAPQPVVV